MFKVSSVGIVAGKDSVLIATNEQNLETQIKEHYKEFDKILCRDIAYRPFDIRKIYYDKTKIDRPRSEVMNHFILPLQNKFKISPSLAEGARGWVKNRQIPKPPPT